MLFKGGRDHIDVYGKILLEYYCLEMDFEREIELGSASKGIWPITGEAGGGERKQDSLTVIRKNQRKVRHYMSNSKKKTAKVKIKTMWLFPINMP